LIPVVPFGEAVWYRELRVIKDRKNKYETEWRDGIWLGHSRRSNEHIIGTVEGVVRAYSVKRRADGERWNGQMIKEMKGSPQAPNPNVAGVQIPIKVRFDPGEPKADAAELVPMRKEVGRRLRLTDAMFKRFGYTEDCEGCRWKQAGLREHRGHTEACRRRLEEALAGTEDGRRLLDVGERQNKVLADYV
jgi:hypothetical protein